MKPALRPRRRPIPAARVVLIATLVSLTAPAQVAISLAVNAHLSFGKLVAGSSPGAVTIGTHGARTASGGVTLGSGTTASPARFTVKGTANTTYAITLPISVTLASGTQSITVDSFTSSPSGTGLLDGSGSQALSIGATLRIGAAQPSGAYSGSLLVTVSYN